MKKFTESIGITELMEPLDKIYLSMKESFKKAGLEMEYEDIMRVKVDDHLVSFKFRFNYFTGFYEFKERMDRIEKVFKTFETKDHEHFFYPVNTDYGAGEMELKIRIEYEDLKKTNMFKSAAGIDKYNL
jgi:hypothetical protein